MKERKSTINTFYFFNIGDKNSLKRISIQKLLISFL